MKKKISENYLLRKPIRNEKYKWTTDDKGIVTLEIENRGVFNRICQKLFKKPPVSYVHLDEMGSFVWPIIDGEMDITRIGEIVDEHFGEKAHPLYERLAKYFQILESYGFVKFNM
ncbi:MAG: PqqD family protein [Ruminococcaceae bacterium]|nr:PqqD family protein [Oscillospiraceae bacterium]